MTITTTNIPSTTGWTLAQWQHAYATQQLQIHHLLQWLHTLPSDDVAWISVCDESLLTQQINDLTQRCAHIEKPWLTLPLYGIPCAVKDNIDVAGFVTTAACPALNTVALEDAYVVELLKQAGAIIVGKTNLDQFATGLVGTRSPYGAVPNTFNPKYVSGGSSSGSASVVARGIVPFALGTDTAGSGRVPAGFNNIVGLKPTKGRFSNRGLLPACKTLDCISIFALTATDAHTVATVMEGYDLQDNYSRQHPKTTPAKLKPSFVCAVPKQLNFFGDTQNEQAFKQAVAQLKNLNADIVEIDFTVFEQLANQLYQGSWVAERTVAVQPWLKNAIDQFDPTVLSIVKQGERFTAMEAYQAEYLKQQLASQINIMLAGVDVLIVPTSPTIRTIAEMAIEPILYNAQFGTYTNFTNLADLSAFAVPAGFREDGLPFGITAIAPAWHDQLLVDFAQRWQAQVSLPLGATGIFASEQSLTLPLSPHHVRVAVVGAHLTGMPLNHQLTSRDAVWVETTTTSADYQLFALRGTVPPKPGLMKVTEGGSAIVLELWDVPLAHFGAFVAEVPPPLGIGNVQLVDGRMVKGFICEPYALDDAINITEFGGWRAYIQSLS